jgi:hypothetical protein
MENLMSIFLKFFEKQLFEKSNKNLTADRIELIQTQIERSTSSLFIEKINEKKLKKIFFKECGSTLNVSQQNRKKIGEKHIE